MSKCPQVVWKKNLLRVGCITTVPGLNFLAHRDAGADLVEVRVDALHQSGLSLSQLLPKLKSRQVPVLLTLRTRSEGGVHPWKSSERVRLFHELLPFVDAVDLELANLSYLESVYREARRLNVGVILSAHSIQRKITYAKALRWLEAFVQHPARIYKIAAVARTRNDLAVLARLVIDHPHLRLAVMALGEQAPSSRIALPALGSRLVYGWLDQPAAANQPSLRELNAILDSIHL